MTSLEPHKESFKSYHTKATILLNMFANCLERKTTLIIKMRPRTTNLRMNLNLWKNKKVKKSKRFKGQIMLISTKSSRKTHTSSWVVVSLVLLILSSLLSKYSQNGLEASNQLKDSFKSMRNKSKPSQRKSDFLKMTRK
jgi:hypothetical protein